MPRSNYCIVCGCHEDEIGRLYCFPTNINRTKLWMDSMGLKGLQSTARICGRHFTEESYQSEINRSLSRSAIPTLFPAYFPIPKTVSAKGESTQPKEPILSAELASPTVEPTDEGPIPVADCNADISSSQNSLNICRLCLQSSELNTDLEALQKLKIWDQFCKITELNLNIVKYYPSKICDSCKEKFREVVNFVSQCRTSQSVLQELYETEDIGTSKVGSVQIITRKINTNDEYIATTSCQTSETINETHQDHINDQAHLPNSELVSLPNLDIVDEPLETASQLNMEQLGQAHNDGDIHCSMENTNILHVPIKVKTELESPVNIIDQGILENTNSFVPVDQAQRILTRAESMDKNKVIFNVIDGGNDIQVNTKVQSSVNIIDQQVIHSNTKSLVPVFQDERKFKSLEHLCKKTVIFDGMDGSNDIRMSRQVAFPVNIIDHQVLYQNTNSFISVHQAKGILRPVENLDKEAFIFNVIDVANDTQVNTTVAESPVDSIDHQGLCQNTNSFPLVHRAEKRLPLENLHKGPVKFNLIERSNNTQVPNKKRKLKLTEVKKHVICEHCGELVFDMFIHRRYNKSCSINA